MNALLKIFLILLPLCSLGFGREYIGMVALNGSLLPFVLGVGLYLLRPHLPIETQSVWKAALLMCGFFGIMELSNLWMGLYYQQTLGISNEGNPLTHSLARAPIPVMLMFVTLFGFLMTSRRHLGYAMVRRVMFWQFIMLIGYGGVQAFSLMFDNAPYEFLANILESGRLDEDISYIRRTGRLNLTTMEASEAGRLLVTFFFPMLFACISFKSSRRGGTYWPEVVGLAVCLPILGMARSTNAFFVLAIVLVAWLLLDLRRILDYALIGGIGLTVVLFFVYALRPDVYSEAYVRIVEKPTSIDDTSAQTRYAFLIASWEASLDNPITGIGIGKGAYVYEQYFPQWGYNWETKHAFATGEAVGPKSLIMRLVSECGFPAILCYLSAIGTIILASFKANNSYVRTYVPLAGIAHLSYSVVGGGMVYIFYSWAIIGILAALIDQYAHLSDDEFDLAVFGAAALSAGRGPLLYSEHRRFRNENDDTPTADDIRERLSQAMSGELNHPDDINTDESSVSVAPQSAGE